MVRFTVVVTTCYDAYDLTRHSVKGGGKVYQRGGAKLYQSTCIMSSRRVVVC